MDPLYERHLGFALLAVHHPEGEPRLGLEVYGARSWWAELRIGGRLIGLYR